MAGGPKRLHHALLGPRQDVAAGPHRPTDEHRLTCELEMAASSGKTHIMMASKQTNMTRSYLVVDGDEGVVRGEGSRGSFAVNEQRPLLPIHNVLLHFGDVVRDVVDDVHVKVIRRRTEHFGEGLKDTKTAFTDSAHPNPLPITIIAESGHY